MKVRQSRAFWARTVAAIAAAARRCFHPGGYAGGQVANATYRNHGPHTEAIEITFNPEQTSYR